MKYTVKPLPEDNLILITIRGEITSGDILQVHAKLHELARDLGIKRILIDLRKCRNIDSEIHKYGLSYTFLTERRNADRTSKVAIVVDKDDNSHNFIGALERNAGLRVVLFRDMDEAESYLKISEKIPGSCLNIAAAN
jgi:hypothetical protein